VNAHIEPAMIWAVAAFLAIASLACQRVSSESARVSELSDDDRQVIAATIEQTLRPRRQVLLKGHLPAVPPVFLVSDSTVGSCSPEYLKSARRWYMECIAPAKLATLERAPVTEWSTRLPSLFADKTRTALRIDGRFGEDVVLVSWKDAFEGAAGVFDLDRLRGSHPPGSAFVQFSAPAYLRATGRSFTGISSTREVGLSISSARPAIGLRKTRRDGSNSSPCATRVLLRGFRASTDAGDIAGEGGFTLCCERCRLDPEMLIDCRRTWSIDGSFSSRLPALQWRPASLRRSHKNLASI
jgi:hypothetical protein